MNSSPDSRKFSDINEAVAEAWEDETTPYERIREVIAHEYTPISAATVAEDARTSPKTARKHLTTLAEEGFVATEPGENGATLFRRSPESLVLEQSANILEELSIDELTEQVAVLRERVTEFQEAHGVQSPEELTIDRTNTALSGDDSPDIDPETIQEWQTTRRNLAFANAALSVANAEQFVAEDTSAGTGSTISQ